MPRATEAPSSGQCVGRTPANLQTIRCMVLLSFGVPSTLVLSHCNAVRRLRKEL